MHPICQEALAALHKTDYTQVFNLLEKANVMNNALHTLRKEYIKNKFDANFDDRLELAIKDAFATHHFAISLPHYPASLSQFIGRQGELDTLHAHLTAGKRTVLVNGLGGVGKTSLAQKYAHDHQADYAHILWIRQSGDLINAFTQTDLLDALRLAYDTQIDRQVLFAEVLKILRNLPPTNLLIIDNYEPTDIDKAHNTLGKLFALPAHWRVVCTSRIDVPIFHKTINLGVLPPDEAIQVFRAHAGGKPLDDTEIDELLKMIGYHTLMTELLAKTYRETIHFDSVGKLHAFLQQEAIAHPKIQEDIHIGTQEIQLYTHLRTVFSLIGLSEDELWLLKQWVVLPTTPHKGTDFLEWIQDTDLAYAKPLKALAKKGWLQTNDRLAYSLHPFLQLFLHQELKPTLPDCYKICEYFIAIMGLNKVQTNPLAYQWTIGVGEAMAQYIDFIDYKKQQGILWNKIHNVYVLLGNYPNAMRCAKEALNIAKATVGEQHEDYATSLNNVAFLYHNQGNYVEALPLFQEALQIKEKVLGKKHSSYAFSLNSLAFLYNTQGNYAKALPLFQEALQIRKEVLEKQHPDIAQSLNNLAALYDNQGNYIEVLLLYQEALQIRKEALEERHPDIANSLNNIGTWYFRQGDYIQARTYFTEAYSICLEKLGEQHPHTQSIKEWLDALPDTV